MSSLRFSLDIEDQQEKRVFFSEASHEARFHVVSSIVAPILLIVAASVLIHVATSHPIGAATELTPDFQIPLMLTLFSGLTGAACLWLGVEIALRKRVFRSWKEIIPAIERALSLVRAPLFSPSKGLEVPPTGYTAVEGSVSATEEDHLGWVREHTESEGRPWAMLIHGSGSAADSMEERGNFYFDRGYNVMLVEIRGFGRSTRSDTISEMQELHAVSDIQSALVYLMDQKNVNPGEVLVHGYSLGGFLAGHLAGDVGALVLERTGPSYAETMKSYAKNHQGLKLPLFIFQLLNYLAFSRGSCIRDRRLTPIKADGFNTEAKLKKARKKNPNLRLFAIHSNQDENMPVDSPERFAKAYFNLRSYGRNKEAYFVDAEISHLGSLFSGSKEMLENWSDFATKFYEDQEIGRLISGLLKSQQTAEDTEQSSSAWV